MRSQGSIVVFHCNGGRLTGPPHSPHDDFQWHYLPCTGATTLGAVLHALAQGHAGVLLAGCPETTCRFPHPAGCPAERLAQQASTLSRMVGLGANRVRYVRCKSVDETLAQAQGYIRRLGHREDT